MFVSCSSTKNVSSDKPKSQADGKFSKLYNRTELVVLEVNDGLERLEVFSMAKDGGKNYFLSVGSLGFGDNVIQVYADPIHELFIPLGTTLDEAETTLGQMKDLLKQPKGTSMEMMGRLDWGTPDENLEKVTLTHTRSLLTRQIMFSVERNGYLRATYISRSDFNSMISSLKFYRKMHPKEN